MSKVFLYGYYFDKEVNNYGKIEIVGVFVFFLKMEELLVPSMHPYKIDGVKAEFYDPYANDQDWALVYYLLINKGL